jgi:glycosyltransferase involved in cell wall biosynthesis
MATSWNSAYYVKSFQSCKGRAYFIQDYEPAFYPTGSESAFAEETYNFGFTAITAGNWLKAMAEAHGMHTHSMRLSFENWRYRVTERRDKDIKRILFYARPPTPRRGFELGMLALHAFGLKHPEVKFIFIGWDISNYDFPHESLMAGIVPPDELTDLYNQCDATLVLSQTNVSLLPLEVMACGCPLVINKGRNNTWLVPENTAIYCDLNVASIVKSLEEALYTNVSQMRENALALTRSAPSWRDEGMQVSEFLKKI